MRNARLLKKGSTAIDPDRSFSLSSSEVMRKPLNTKKKVTARPPMNELKGAPSREDLPMVIR